MAPKPKKTISTIGMFKNKRPKHPHPPPRTPTKKPKLPAAKPPKNLPPFKRPSKSKPRLKPPILPHPLAQNLSEALSTTRTHILRTARSTLSETRASLQDQLLRSHASSKRNLHAPLTAIKTSLAHPFASELLQFKDHEGKVSGMATLGDRMKGFEDVVKREEGVLSGLWDEWRGVQGEIGELVKGFVEGREGEEGWEMGGAWVDGVVGGVKGELEGEVRALGEKAVGDMERSEKAMDARANKQHEEVLAALKMRF